MNLDRKLAAWTRLVPVLVAAVLLCVVLRGLPQDALLQVLGRLRIGWLIAALILYGAIFVPAAWRWHLVLRLAHAAVGFGQTLKTSLIGHFFYTICFGVVGGDSAKAVIYAQRFGFSSAAVLATAPPDRLLGFVGSAIFTGVALLMGCFAGAFQQSSAFSIQSPTRAMMLVCVPTAAIVLLGRRLLAVPAVHRFWSHLKINLRLVSRSIGTLLAGFGCGFLVQLVLTGALACNLAAVSEGPVPWQKILWTFPFIIAVSALPISIGGLGTREGAAIVLWGAYGVARADAIAASLLTLTVALCWAAVGGLLLLTSENKRRASYWRAVSKGDAGFPQKIQASQSGKLLPISSP